MKPVAKTVEIKSGFFPSLVYLPVPQALSQEPFLCEVEELLKSQHIQYQLVKELHVSVSKTFHPLENEIGKIVSKLKESLQNKLLRLPVVLLLERVIVIDNFLAVEVAGVTRQKLVPFVLNLEKIVKEPFYQDPIFHVSLFKVLSEIDPPTLERITSVPLPRGKAFVLERCCLKTGKVFHRLC